MFFCTNNTYTKESFPVLVSQPNARCLYKSVDFKSFISFCQPHMSQTSPVLSPRFTLSSSLLSLMISLWKQVLLFCNPLYLFFRIPSNQFLLFLMIQIRNNYKFNILALARKENRSKSSWLCNSFVMDQITKMNVQVQPYQKKK